MDDRLKAALEEGAKNGAVEVFEKHDEYMNALKEEMEHYNAVLKEAKEAYVKRTQELKDQYADNEAQYAFAQSILNGIINKLDKKE